MPAILTKEYNVAAYFEHRGGKARRSRRKQLARLSRCSAFNLVYVTWLPKRKSRHYQNEISKILRRKSKLQARYIPARFNVFFCAYVCECARVWVCVCKRATLESENRVQLQNSCSIPVRLTGTGRCSWKWISNHIWVPATVAAICLRPASVQYSVPVVDLAIRHKRTYISLIRSAEDRAATTTTTMEAEEITKLVDGVYRVSLWSLSLHAFSAVLVSSGLFYGPSAKRAQTVPEARREEAQERE